jgi:hypothetical protein
MYVLVASTSLSSFEAIKDRFKLIMKEIFVAYVMWPFDKSFVFELETRANTRNLAVNSIITRV